MRLLKLCNPNALTESVEHLLDDMVEERGSLDGVSAVDRLNRLSEAFGAIQKCLEGQSAQGDESPQPAQRNAVFTASLRQRLASPAHSQSGQDTSEPSSPRAARRGIAFQVD